jgi:ankyrin repeat protein
MDSTGGNRRGALGAALTLAVALATTLAVGGAAQAATPVAVVDVNARQADGSTALLWAAYSGDTARVAELLKAGADASLANNYGATPMAEAARTGNAEVLRLLLKAGADPESPNGEGQTALMAVARTGDIEAAKLLLKHGAKVDAREQWGGQTALIWAAAQKQPQMIQFLLKQGADANARAIVRDWQRRVTAEGRPKDMNRGGFTPLLYAAREGCLACAAALVKGAADVNLPDPDGTTPLTLALMNGQWNVAKFLIDSGADVNAWDFWGQSPLYMAVDMNILPGGARIELPSMDETTGVEVIKLLLAKGANPNVQLKLRPPYRQAVFDRGADGALVTGATPLMRAAVAADLDAIDLLLKAGALVDLPNEDGVTPFVAAVSAAGTRGRDKTEARAVEAMKLLRAAGANVNAANRRGLTAAHSAAFRGWHDAIKLLASYGANLDAKEVDNLTPLDFAMGRSRVGFLQTKPPVRNDTAAVLRAVGATAENPKLPPWPAIPTPTLTAQVPE